MVIRVHGHSDEPVVTFGFSVFGLIRFDDSDQADLDEATDVRRSVHENHDIERSPSSPSVEGMKPKSNGNIIPWGRRPPNMNEFESGS